MKARAPAVSMLFDLESVYKRLRTYAHGVFGDRLVRGLVSGDHGFFIKNRGRRSIKVSRSTDEDERCIKVMVPLELLNKHGREGTWRSYVRAPKRNRPDRVIWVDSGLSASGTMQRDSWHILFCFHEPTLAQRKEDMIKLMLTTAADKAETVVVIDDDE
jgi:hypothetical protein